MAKTLEEAKNKVSETMGRYTDLASGGATIADVLKEKALKVFDNNQDIVKPLDEATATYYSAPSTARDKYQGIFNPFTREKLVSQYTNNASLPMLMYANLYGNRMGRIDDLINSGTNAYKAEITSAEGAASAAQREYDNLLKEYELNQKYADSGANSQIMNAVMALLSGGGEVTPTEEAPMYSPTAGIGSMSKGGEWTYSDKGWVPVQQSKAGMGSNLDPVSQLILSGAISKGDYSTAQKILGGGSNQLDFSKIMTLANYGKPTATQEAQAANAQSGLDSIRYIRENIKGLKGAVNPIYRTFDPKSQVLYKQLTNIADIITRYRTGAALNADEQTFYNSFVADPVQTVLGYTKGTDAALKILEKIFQSGVDQAKNPYQSVLDSYIYSNFGQGGGDWEVVE